MDEERIEEIVERKIREKESEDSKTGIEDDQEMSRRKFLKLAGLGAGGLALTSSTAAVNWGILQKPSQGKSDVDAEKLDGKNADELRPLPLIVPAVNIQAGETMTVARFNNPSGKNVKIWKAVVSKAGGGSDPNLQLEVQNVTDATQIYSTTSNTIQEGSPLASGGSGDEIEVRINNNDSSADFDAVATLICTVE